MIIGHAVINGVPYINGKRAKHSPPSSEAKRHIELLDGAFSEWRCPECDARLSGEDMICLNTCHLSAAANRRFMELMGEAVARVKRREHDEKTLSPLEFLAKYGNED